MFGSDALPAAPPILELTGASRRPSTASTPEGVGLPIPIGRQDDELRRLAARSYAAGFDEHAVRAAIRSTIETRCLETEPVNPWTDAYVERLARPVSDTLGAGVASGRLA